MPPMSFQERASEKRAPESIVENLQQTPLRILFVEDNDYVRDLTLCLLEDANREVVAFGSAEEALAEFKREPFDVVITDVSLPGMSGIEFAKRLLKVAPETWLVIASGYQLPGNLHQLGRNVRSMTKPFESEHIDAILAEVRDARA
jgi:two-component system, cell cycle response regulator CpdR